MSNQTSAGGFTPPKTTEEHIRVAYAGGGETSGERPEFDPDITPSDWLLTGGKEYPDTRSLFRDFCTLLVCRGIPLYRATCFIRTLHPQATGNSIVWRRNQAEPTEITLLRGIEETPAFRNSPLPIIFEGASAIRRRLDIPDFKADFTILDDLKNEGATDYVAMPLRFSDGTINFITWATDQPGGFATEDLAQLWEILPVLALRLEVLQRQKLSRLLLEIYLGKDAGHRVLNGQIVRGQGQAIDAVVWYADLRGFTAMTDALPSDEIIPMLNAFFECMTQPIDERGGEVLKFMGDGMLAIFPYDDDNLDTVCGSALKAAREVALLISDLNQRRMAKGMRRLDYGIALHIGKVHYGNIGAPDRLDFTVIGPAVNLTSRIQGLAKRLHTQVVTSAAFAAHSGGDLKSAGWHPIRGLTEPVEIFTL